MKQPLRIILPLMCVTFGTVWLEGSYDKIVREFVRQFPAAEKQPEKALWYALDQYKHEPFNEYKLDAICRFLIDIKPELTVSKNKQGESVLEYMVANTGYSRFTVEALLKQGFICPQDCLRLAIQCRKDAAYIQTLLQLARLNKYVTITSNTYHENKMVTVQKTMPALEYYLQERKRLSEGARSNGLLYFVSGLAGDQGQVDPKMVKILTI